MFAHAAIGVIATWARPGSPLELRVRRSAARSIDLGSVCAACFEPRASVFGSSPGALASTWFARGSARIESASSGQACSQRSRQKSGI